MCSLTHWGRVTHICVGNRIIIGSDNGLSPGRRQAIILTNADMLLIGPVGTNFNEILIEIHTFSFKKMHLNMSSGKWRPFCLGLNVLMHFARCSGYSWVIMVVADALVLIRHRDICNRHDEKDRSGHINALCPNVIFLYKILNLILFYSKPWF